MRRTIKGIRMKTIGSKVLLLAPCVLIGGCALGYNTTLFMTKSNLGIDIDAKPPTAEISIARREGVISPGFEGGQTPPVISSFGTNTNLFGRFLFGVQSSFAGGQAALALSQGPDGAASWDGSEVCLSKAPEPKKGLFWDLSIPGPGEVKPFVFGTDTSFGLKIAWSGMTAQFPDTLRLGFNRKEFALAPVFATDKADCTIPGTTQKGSHAVMMPPFLAVLDSSTQVGSPDKTGLSWRQYFATGPAATTLANFKEMREVMLKRMEPNAKFTKVKCIKDWLNEDLKARVSTLNGWWKAKGNDGLGTAGVVDEKNKEYAVAFMTENDVTCN